MAMRTELSRITKYPARGLPSIEVFAGEDNARRRGLEVMTGGIRAETHHSAAKLARWPVRLTNVMTRRGRPRASAKGHLRKLGIKACRLQLGGRFKEASTERGSDGEKVAGESSVEVELHHGPAQVLDEGR